jgi:hypothetical protein
MATATTTSSRAHPTPLRATVPCTSSGASSRRAPSMRPRPTGRSREQRQRRGHGDRGTGRRGRRRARRSRDRRTGYDGGGSDRGVAWLVLGPATGSLAISSAAEATINGSSDDAGVGARSRGATSTGRKRRRR